MARASYLAPGVYVEEVPSAQQPIAGVGTNTVGFIGLVPDVIYIAEPNPDYDPVLAQAAIGLVELRAEASHEPRPEIRALIEADIVTETRELDLAIQRLQTRLTELQGTIIPTLTTARDNAQAAVDEANRALNDFDASFRPEANATPEATAQRRTRERRPLDRGLSRATDEFAAANTQLSERTTELTAVESELNAVREARDRQPQPSTPSEEVPARPARNQPPPDESALPDEAVLVRKSLLRPYVLRRFDVPAGPGDTKLCTNFTEYTNRFGSFSADYPDYVPTRDHPARPLFPGHRALTHAVNGFFKNGGTRCFVARVASNNVDEIRRTLEAFESIDEVAIIAAPGFSDQVVWDELLSHCEKCEDRFAILDSPEFVETDGELDLTLLNYNNPSSQDYLPPRNRNAAFYFPQIEVVDAAKQLQDEDPIRRVEPKYRGRVYVPPSGHVAGIYARTDEQRGVHKAPANSTILGALNVKYYISKPKQELLNPQGVNCIRNLNGTVTVWGARTVGGDKNGEWKYINVRRFFLFLRESIDEGTQWIVFEPNDQALWGKIRRNLSAFLTNVWRSGALFGATPEEAFYVKCDAELNPPEVRDLGMVVTEIGVAIVRPAEFVIFRVTQDTGPRTS
jgi:phage tail sheath protein FI